MTSALIQSKEMLPAMQAVARQVDKLIDCTIKDLPAGGARLVAAMRYAAMTPGKRLRPFLVICSSEVFDVARPQAIRVAAAMECIHCYSLIHDDLPAMDDDDLRRGMPTVHKQFDDATAILAGDALLTLAFEILADPDTHPDGAVRASLCAAFAKAAGYRGMVGGQMMDIMAETSVPDINEIAHMQQLKTGALLAASAEAGAILGRAEWEHRENLKAYGRCLGLAFQIADDLLDVEGDEEEVGKAVGKDAAAGKATFVGLLGVDGAREEALRLADLALDHISSFGEEATLLRAIAHFAVHRRS